MERPRPPETLFEIDGSNTFVPAPEIIEWARATFIDEGASVENPEHNHLRDASICALWTNVPNAKHGMTVLAQCEPGDPMAMGKWAKARARQQVEEWFGHIPDFILTFDAGYAEACGDVEFMALVEHELYHAAQDKDAYGAPKFGKTTGKPVFTMRGHDVQEFTSVVRRYGADAAHVREFVDAVSRPPEIGRVSVAHACGTRQLRVA